MKTFTLSLFFWLICSLPQWACAATVPVDVLDGDLDPPTLSINLGDTVVWTNENTFLTIRSYDGGWNSELLQPHETAAVTFPKAGFFPYKTQYGGTGAGEFLDAGTITVRPWSNSPPPITLNFPIEGFFFVAPAFFSPLASLAAGLTNIVRVDFYGGTNFLGSASNAPYRVNARLDAGFTLQIFDLVAQAVDGQGRVTSSAPVHVSVQNLGPRKGHVSYPQLLPSGQFLCYYSTSIGSPFTPQTSTDLLNWEGCGSLPTFGVLVFEGAINRPMQFFRVVYCP